MNKNIHKVVKNSRYYATVAAAYIAQNTSQFCSDLAIQDFLIFSFTTACMLINNTHNVKGNQITIC